MKVMFDSGATASFINRTALTRTHHLPIKFKNITYTMADGYTTMEVVGTVKIFIELNNIKTDIEIGIVDSLCTDCMLGMDYMNKYKVTLNNYSKQVQINTSAGPTTLPMVQHSIKTTKALCRSSQFVHLNPYQERRIKLISQVSSGQFLFTPTYRITKIQGLVILHSLISIKNHTTWITVYNPTPYSCYLKQNTIIGIATSLTIDMSISTILDLNTTDNYDKDYTNSFKGNSADNIRNLLENIQDPQLKHDLFTILKKHHPLFDATATAIAETSIHHVICTGDNPPTTSRPNPQTIDKQDATFDIIQQMLKHKQIRPSFSQYSALILLIKKRDGSYRFIIDYRKVNNITIPDNYPLPNLE